MGHAEHRSLPLTIYSTKRVDDPFKIAAILVNGKHDFIQKAVGSWGPGCRKKR